MNPNSYPAPARPAARTRRFKRPVVALLVVVASLVGWLVLHEDSANVDGPPVAPPWEFTSAGWDVLGGDVALTGEAYTALASHHPGLDPVAAKTTAATAALVTVADLTGRGRDQWPGYWPPAATTSTGFTQRCASVSVRAASPVPMPVSDSPTGIATGAVPDVTGEWVKVLVAYTGRCAEAAYTDEAPGVAYVYGRIGNDGLVPVREWNIPYDVPDSEGDDLAEWQLAPITQCATGTGDPVLLRTFAASAFDQMCADADTDGVVLVAESGYRSKEQQAELFADAVDYYGTDAKARKWVAYADEQVCESRHCTGAAVNVEPDHAATTWLWQVVACVNGEQTFAAQECADGQTPVRRAQTYGFVLPYERIPGYAEFVLQSDDAYAEANCAPSGSGVDVMVASVFRCRLSRAQVSPVVIETVVREALAVSRCTSAWNPTAVAYGGRYATEPNPADGRVYDEAGVFMLRGTLAEAGWVPGGVDDPVANIHGAASLWLATRGWEQFGCATGTDPGFAVGPVLPQYGGPALPQWSTGY